MLSIVHTAEVQFRHESSLREREFAILAAMRDRQAAVAYERLVPLRAPRRAVAWPRPIGAPRASGFAVEPCPAVA
jgi:hypothetical protein